MKIYPMLLMVISLFSSCVGNNEHQDFPKLEYAFLKHDGVVNPKLRGVWKSIGNGYLLEATGDSILLYSYTKNFCYKEKNDYLEGLLNSQTQFLRQNDTVSLYLTDFGEKTYQLQSKKDFVEIDRLPENCMGFSELQQAGSEILFDLFIETLQENYAFSKERGQDWKEIQREYENIISHNTTQEELFQVMGDIVTLTKDHHTKIISKDGKRIQYTVTPSANLVINAFNNQSKVKDLNSYFDLFFKTQYKNISDSLLHGKGQKAANGKIEWGSLNEPIGYINVHGLTGFAPSELSRRQHIDSLNYHMERIIRVFKDKKAVIVDVSFNFGGYDAAGLTIASYFTDTKVSAYTVQVYHNSSFYDESTLFVEPASKINFTKPVYLITTDISRSAAESFAMQMKAIPNVKLVGTNTLGILSGMLGKSIGDFYSTFSNQRYLSPQGNFYEVTGVEPDIEIEVFKQENIFQSHMEAVREIVDIIEKSH